MQIFETPNTLFDEIQTHNNARDTAIMSRVADFWDAAAEPLLEHVFIPLEKRNHAAAIVALNGGITGPRIIERWLGNRYLEAIRDNNHGKATLALGAKAVAKASDGLDGPIARGAGLATEFGAAWDPFVDLAGSYDDCRVAIELAQAEGDGFTVKLLRARLAVDAAVVAIAGIGNGAAAKYAESKGVELTAAELPRASANGKLKYGIGAAGSVEILASYNMKEDSMQRKIMKRVGQAKTALSIGVGAYSLIGYGTSAISKVRKARANQV